MCQLQMVALVWSKDTESTDCAEIIALRLPAARVR